MQGKKGLVFFAAVITALCLFYLSFTFVARGIKGDQEAYSLDKKEVAAANGVTGDDLNKVYKRAYTDYRDSIWNQEVYFGWTYADVKKFELNLGLDLQGGMHITLMIDAKEFLESKSNFNKNVNFNKALANAQATHKGTQEPFTSLFYKEWLKLNNDQEGKLAKIFYNPKNQKNITRDASDEDVLNWLNTELEEAAELSKNILANRIDEFGATQPIIEVVKSTGRIEIELPGVDDEERIKQRITAAAQLKFMEELKANESASLYNSLSTKFPKTIVETEVIEEEIETETVVEEDLSLGAEGNDDTTSSDSAVVEVTEEDIKVEEVETKEQIKTLISVTGYNQDPQTGQINFISFGVSRKDKPELDAFLEREDVRALFPKNVSIYYGKPQVASTGADQTDVYPVYFIKAGKDGMPLMGGPGTPDYIENAWQDYDQEGKPAVMISFNAMGGVEWAKTTGKAAQSRFNVAIILDDVVYSAPRVEQKISGGGNTIVQGSFSIEEAQDLANVLKSGKLKIKTTVEGIAEVGASLGQEAVDRGLISLAAGLALVIIFMMMYYGKGGTIANIALLFNIFFILGILSVPSLGAALTLPGIAGIVLTMGMSIDANVLIFERIKEEIKNGVSAKAAIQIGYKKAFMTILDANLTTLITAVILFSFGTGLVKGFATTLIIGVLSSFFSAVYITRLIIEFIVDKKNPGTVSFDTAISKTWFTNLNFTVIAKRKIAYVISAVVIAVGIGSIAMQGGLNLGVDFEGGRSMVVKFDKDVKVEDIRSAVKSVVGDASCEVKTFDTDNQVQIKTNFMLGSTDENVDAIVRKTVKDAITATDASLNPSIQQFILVNPTISEDIKDKSVISILISLVAIFFYILVRFKKWQFGLGALIALFHDVLVVISVFSIVRLFGVSFEIDSIFVAAMLTIVGYSINDTVVVFDRVREYLGRFTNGNLPEIFNDAINSTLSRTLMTSLTTLLVVLILFIFGGDALRGFSFALLIGVFVGTYSSIFIATPSVLDTSEKKISEEAKKENEKNN